MVQTHKLGEAIGAEDRILRIKNTPSTTVFSALLLSQFNVPWIGNRGNSNSRASSSPVYGAGAVAGETPTADHDPCLYATGCAETPTTEHAPDLLERSQSCIKSCDKFFTRFSKIM